MFTISLYNLAHCDGSLTKSVLILHSVSFDFKELIYSLDTRELEIFNRKLDIIEFVKPQLLLILHKRGPFFNYLSQCVALLHKSRLVCISSKIFYKTNTASDMKKKSSYSFVNKKLTKCKQISLAAVRMMPLP